MTKLVEDVWELQICADHWALTETGKGLFEATAKQVAFIKSLIDGAKGTGKDGAVHLALLGAGVNPDTYDDSDLADLSAGKASKLINNLKPLAPEKKVTLSQLNYLKTLLGATDPDHGAVMSAVQTITGLPTNPGWFNQGVKHLSTINSAQASDLIDWLKKHGAKYKKEPITPKQVKTLLGLENDLTDLHFTNFSQLYVAAGVPHQPPGKLTSDQANAVISQFEKKLAELKPKSAPLSLLAKIGALEYELEGAPYLVDAKELLSVLTSAGLAGTFKSDWSEEQAEKYLKALELTKKTLAAALGGKVDKALADKIIDLQIKLVSTFKVTADEFNAMRVEGGVPLYVHPTTFHTNPAKKYLKVLEKKLASLEAKHPEEKKLTQDQWKKAMELHSKLYGYGLEAADVEHIRTTHGLPYSFSNDWTFRQGEKYLKVLEKEIQHLTASDPPITPAQLNKIHELENKLKAQGWKGSDFDYLLDDLGLPSSVTTYWYKSQGEIFIQALEKKLKEVETPAVGGEKATTAQHAEITKLETMLQLPPYKMSVSFFGAVKKAMGIKNIPTSDWKWIHADQYLLALKKELGKPATHPTMDEINNLEVLLLGEPYNFHDSVFYDLKAEVGIATIHSGQWFEPQAKSYLKALEKKMANVEHQLGGKVSLGIANAILAYQEMLKIDWKVPAAEMAKLRKDAGVPELDDPKDFFKLPAEKYLKALKRKLGELQAHKAGAPAAGHPSIPKDVTDKLFAMAQALDFKHPELHKAGLHKGNWQAMLKLLPEFDVTSLLHHLGQAMASAGDVGHLVGKAQDALAAGTDQHHLQQVWAKYHLPANVTVHTYVPKAELHKILADLQHLVDHPQPPKHLAKPKDVGLVLSLLMALGPKSWKKSHLSKQYTQTQLRTAELKKMPEEDIKKLIFALQTDLENKEAGFL